MHKTVQSYTNEAFSQRSQRQLMLQTWSRLRLTPVWRVFINIGARNRFVKENDVGLKEISLIAPEILGSRIQSRRLV